MSTRANVILKESYSYKAKNGKTVNRTNQLIFYRHSDGYPEGALPSLKKLTEWIKAGKIRNNLSQGAGWLVVIGAMEYNTVPKFETKIDGSTSYGLIETFEDPKDWKVGSWEPTTTIHGDIEFLYEIDMSTMDLIIKRRVFGENENLDTWEVITLNN
jgi:hypothetical protein